MIHALEPLPPQTAPENPEQYPTAGLEHPALAECEQEWQRVYEEVRNRKKGRSLAISEANWAYREAMPPLIGYANICTFIACVTYGMLMGRFEEKEGPRLLYAAQVALSTIPPHAKTSARSAQAQTPKSNTPNPAPQPPPPPPSPAILPYPSENIAITSPEAS